MLVDGPLDAEGDALEPPEAGDDRADADAEDDALRAGREAAGGEDEVVEEVREHEDGEVEGWELWGRKGEESVEERRQKEERGEGGTHVVVDVGDTAHDQERNCRNLHIRPEECLSSVEPISVLKNQTQSQPGNYGED